jgi:serine/threonine protein kinase
LATFFRPGRSDAAQVVEILARTMHAVHHQGIVHRDLKPANILLARSDRVQSGSSGIKQESWLWLSVRTGRAS